MADTAAAIRPDWLIEPPFDFEGVPDAPAVFVVRLGEAEPYLGRTSMLRRRLSRLLGEAQQGSRRLNLRGIATAVEGYAVRGKLPAALLNYRLARRIYPGRYVEMLKLRFPAYVKLIESNKYPRTEVTSRISGTGLVHYGPFRSRAAAERFEGEALDQYQVRRCVEDLAPSAEHPGCIYGEMGRCLRPCQDVVSAEEYGGESRRLAHFLETGGTSLLEPLMAARDRLSAEMDFEQAGRQHERIQRIEQMLKLSEGLAGDAAAQSGIAVYPSPRQGWIDLHLMLDGIFVEPAAFPISAGAAGSMDGRLKEIFQSIERPKPVLKTRMEHLALLARWYYSSYRDADWLAFEHGQPPYRRIVRAISKAAAGMQAGLFPGLFQ
jgi:excinuclease UvrABC nuclease subunit